mgnify:FL=1
MVCLPPNSKIAMSFNQGNIGSQVLVDIGSCVSVYGLDNYSGLDFIFNDNNQNLPFQIPKDREERILICGSISVGVVNAGSNIGCITFEILHDLKGPANISQISPQIVVRDSNGNALCNPYKPRELHQFDLNKGKVLTEISLNDSKLFTIEINS